MKLAYVSGKYTDTIPYKIHLNMEKAKSIAAALWSLGIANICPHTNAGTIDGVTSYDTFLKGCLLQVARCDLLVMLENWLDSNGAQAELRHATERGIPALFWPTDLEAIIEFCHPKGIPLEHVTSARAIMDKQLMQTVDSYYWRTTK